MPVFAVRAVHSKNILINKMCIFRRTANPPVNFRVHRTATFRSVGLDHLLLITCLSFVSFLATVSLARKIRCWCEGKKRLYVIRRPVETSELKNLMIWIAPFLLTRYYARDVYSLTCDPTDIPEPFIERFWQQVIVWLEL